MVPRRRKSPKPRRWKQTDLVFRTWGGRREGAGRPRKSERKLVPHLARPALNGRHPAQVTLTVGRGVPNLRAELCMAVLRGAFAKGKERFGFRLIHHSVQANHLHLVVEAAGTSSLSRGLQGLSVRIARGLNKALGRRGRVFADRYHARALATPREVHHALRYVLLNAHHHSRQSGSSFWRFRRWDPCSSGEMFDGWLGSGETEPRGKPPSTFGEKGALLAQPLRETVVAPEVWLLRVGWRKHGLIRPWGVP